MALSNMMGALLRAFGYFELVCSYLYFKLAVSVHEEYYASRLSWGDASL